MKIQLNTGRAGHTMFHAELVNASAARRNQGGIPAAGRKEDRDRASFSIQGSLMGMIDRLRERKEAIVERRDELIEKTLKNGGDMDDIKDQLKDYEKQLRDVDKQIASLYEQQLKDAIDQEDKDKKKSVKADSEKSKEQRDVEHMVNLAGISERISQTGHYAAAQSDIQGEIHVKQAEQGQSSVEIQRLEGISMDGKTEVDPLIETLERSVQAAEKDISGLQKKLDQLAMYEGKHMRGIMNEMDESRENAVDAAVQGAKAGEPGVQNAGDEKPGGENTVAGGAEVQTAEADGEDIQDDGKAARERNEED